MKRAWLLLAAAACGGGSSTVADAPLAVDAATGVPDAVRIVPDGSSVLSDAPPSAPDSKPPVPDAMATTPLDLVGTIGLTGGATATGMVADPKLARFLLDGVLGSASSVDVVDAAKLMVTMNIPLPAVSSGMSLNPATRKLYVAGDGGVTVVDVDQGKIVGHVDAQYFFGVAVAANPTTNRIFVLEYLNLPGPSYHDAAVLIIDGATDTELNTLRLSGNRVLESHPQSFIAVDPTLDLAFVATNRLPEGYLEVTEILGDGSAGTSILDGDGFPRWMAYDARDQVIVACVYRSFTATPSYSVASFAYPFATPFLFPPDPYGGTAVPLPEGFVPYHGEIAPLDGGGSELAISGTSASGKTFGVASYAYTSSGFVQAAFETEAVADEISDVSLGTSMVTPDGKTIHVTAVQSGADAGTANVVFLQPQ
jgi:hypothetical protein